MRNKIIIVIAALVAFVFVFGNPLNLLPDSPSNNPIHAEYTNIYIDREHADGYRMKRSGVQYYEVCGGKLRMCKVKLDGVDRNDFTPLGRYLAKEVNNGETKIFYKGIDITAVIADPQNFRALEPLSMHPRYFTDDEYIYEDRMGLSGELWSTTAVSDFDESYSHQQLTSTNQSELFPLKVSEDDSYLVPEQFQLPPHPSFISQKILFVNNDVYLNGQLIYGADAATFSEVAFEDTSKPNIGPWFKDASRVYYEGFLVSNADPSTFRLLRPEGSTAANSFLAADQNYVFNDYGFLGECHLVDTNCVLDMRIPGVSPVGISVPSTTDVTAWGTDKNLFTIENNSGTFYLDGLRKTGTPVEVVVNRYDVFRAQHNQYGTSFTLRTYVNDEFCSSVIAAGSNERLPEDKVYTVFVNEEEAGAIDQCRDTIRTTLPDGPSTIAVVDATREIIFTRTYVNTGNISE